jgi:hypothetical protein
MSKVKYVALNRAEGPTADCGAVVFAEDAQERPEVEDERRMAGARMVWCQVGKLAECVERKLREWGQTAPEGGGYHKVDFEVGWDDGETYAGRFDMERGGTDGGEQFWASLRGRLEVYSLRRRPSHFKDKDWDSFSQRMREDGMADGCAKLLDRHEVPA